MRFSSRLVIKIALTSAIFSFLYILYNFYVDNSSDKVPAISRKDNSVVRKSEGDFNLFKHVDNRFEDMYNFNVGIKFMLKRRSKNIRYPKHEIEIWGKASIAEYLWTHILDANSTTYANGLIKHGEIVLENLHMRFRSGPGIVQNTVPSSVKNLVLVLNGKDEVKIKFSKYWLDYLVHFKSLKNVALVILGDEKCNNDWILPYLKTRGGVLDFVFIIYDSKLVDNKEFYQWPLGVATYRGFPNLKPSHVNADVARQHLCSFLGTVYKNTSREILSNLLKKSKKCYMASRDTWVPVETYESMGRYIKKISESDLTLNPAGQNTECYRIYEAFSLGSVPVVENVLTPGNCDAGQDSPLRLLKEHKAPVIFVRSWSELDEILETEGNLSLEAKVDRRKRVIKWYENFKLKMRSRFIRLIKKHFFKEDDGEKVF